MTKQDDRLEIPDWKCERHLLGELDESEMEHIRRRSEHDADLRSRLEALERSNREVLDRYPAAVAAGQIERKLAAARASVTRRAEPRPWWTSRLAWVPAAAVAAVVAVVALNPGVISEWSTRERVTGQAPTTRIKGSAAALSLYRWTPDGSVRLESGDVAVEHDRILATYHSDGRTWGLILSVDGRGVLTRHHPRRGGPALLEAGGPHALDFSYELDDAPRYEIFILADSRDDFDAKAVIDPIASSRLVQAPGISVSEAESVLKSLPVPAGISLTTFTLIKEGRP